jgi:spermidine/putrescine transport system ATP-binding protein
MEKFLELTNISKSYGSDKVLDNINFKIKNNEFFTILGSSGSGKSTIIRMIGGFIQPSSGKIIFENKIINNQPIFERPFNTVFQDYALFPNMNVFNNVGFGLKIKNVNKNVIKEKVFEVLSIVGLESFANRMPQELSGGQQQRVALARAIICEPKIILLDEPLGALDAELRKQMQLFLKEIQKKINIAFIFITHDQEEAIFLSDRIAVLNQHKFEQIGTPKELYYNPTTTYLAKFFGECNLFECNITDLEKDIATLDSSLGKFKTKIKDKDKNIKVGDNIIYGIRPEEITLSSDKDDDSFKLYVKKIDFKGPNSILHLISKNKKLTIKLQNLSSNVSESYAKDSILNVNFNLNSGNIFLK